MIVDCPRDIVRLALRARVKSTHDALQLRKFPDHSGDQVALRQFRRAVRTCHICLRNSAAEPLLRQPTRQRTHPLDFIAVASQARFVSDRRELRQIIAQPDLLIRLPEKLRIRESRAQYAFVAGTHQTFGSLRQIDHSQKMRRQLPVARFQGEIFLMVAHYGQQNFVGQREIRWIEIAYDYARVFVEICHQLQQLGIFMRVQALRDW